MIKKGVGGESEVVVGRRGYSKKRDEDEKSVEGERRNKSKKNKEQSNRYVSKE